MFLWPFIYRPIWWLPRQGAVFVVVDFVVFVVVLVVVIGMPVIGMCLVFRMTGRR